MELDVIQMERPAARQAFLEYRRAVREAREQDLQDELARVDEEMMRGYRALAAGHQVISLRGAMTSGGTTTQNWHYNARPHTVFTSVLPRLAVARADASEVFTDGINRDGSLRVRSQLNISSRNRRAQIRFGMNTFPRHDLYQEDWERDHAAHFRAMVPHVPPLLRPAHHLRNYHILWDAKWELRDPPPPVDPALLKHLGGDLYAVVAVWELTEPERAVLAAR